MDQTCLNNLNVHARVVTKYYPNVTIGGSVAVWLLTGDDRFPINDVDFVLNTKQPFKPSPIEGYTCNVNTSGDRLVNSCTYTSPAGSFDVMIATIDEPEMVYQQDDVCIPIVDARSLLKIYLANNDEAFMSQEKYQASSAKIAAIRRIIPAEVIDDYKGKFKGRALSFDDM